MKAKLEDIHPAVVLPLFFLVYIGFGIGFLVGKQETYKEAERRGFGEFYADGFHWKEIK